MADIFTFAFLAEAMPVIFMLVMGLAVAAYVLLDGYDLGIGMMMSSATTRERDLMISVIGPFWDANETWLVLGVGILLVAFPMAHGYILQELYLPTAIMLGGLIMRGVAFDFRTKAHPQHHEIWNQVFAIGSLIATMTQGYMLAMYIVGFERTPATVFFGILTGLSLAAGYVLLGACRLIAKTEGELQQKAIAWARPALWFTAMGMAVVSMVTPLVSERIFAKWFALPQFFLLLPIPLLAGVAVLWLDRLLAKLPLPNDAKAAVPFWGACGLFLSGFLGLGYSFFPYIVPEKMTVWQAAAAPEALVIILAGALVVLPCIIAYTVYAYMIFKGKINTPLEY